jgi:hypothetical protein
MVVEVSDIRSSDFEDMEEDVALGAIVVESSSLVEGSGVECS